MGKRSKRKRSKKNPIQQPHVGNSETAGVGTNDEGGDNDRESGSSSDVAHVQTDKKSLGALTSGESSKFNPVQLPSAEHRVLFNDLLLSKIFTYMDLQQIKKCEDVCQLWKQIMNMELTTINLNIRPNTETINKNEILFYESSAQKAQTKILIYSTMDHIETVIQSTPCKKITINSWTSSNWNSEVVNFCSRFGQDVVEIQIQGEEPGTSPIFMFYYKHLLYLRTEFPNLKHLKFKPIVSPRLFLVDDLPVIQGLQSLEKITIWRHYNMNVMRTEKLPVDLKIFISSPNVNSIYNFPIQHINELQDLNKIPMVKSFLYNTFNFNNDALDTPAMNHLNTSLLSMYNVELDQLLIVDAFALNNNPGRNVQSLSTFNRLLCSSRNSLRKLKLQPLIFVPFLDYPVLPKLKSLQLSKTNQISNNYFSPNFNSSLFPNLHIIDLNISIESTEVLNEILPPDVFNGNSTFKSVSKIVIRKKIGPFQLQEISMKLFPNVHSVEVVMSQETMETLPSIFICFPHLKTLEVTMKVDDELICLDSCFLGVSEETIQDLNSVPVSKLEFKNLQVNPSLSNLKDLTSLVFNVFDAGASENSPQILSGLFLDYFLKYQKFNIQIKSHESTLKESRDVILDRFRFLKGRIEMKN